MEERRLWGFRSLRQEAREAMEERRLWGLVPQGVKGISFENLRVDEIWWQKFAEASEAFENFYNV